MRLSILLASSYVTQTIAFPAPVFEALRKRQVPSLAAARALSKARTNCGILPCEVFDAKAQFVSTTGEHAYVAPSSTDIRGECPGLNAAANHGYISRSGVTNIEDTAQGLLKAYGMSIEFSGFLAAYAVLTSGDPLLQTWSIGGPLPTDAVTEHLLGQGWGIDYSHNVYEGDSSIGRPDAWLNNGDAFSLDLDRFRQAYETGTKDGTNRYTLDKISQLFADQVEESIATNPYYFAAPFSTTLASPVAHYFVINLMSNHSAEEPNGYLDPDMLKQFFAVTGDYPNFKWNPGQERIPDNWYRRPYSQPYGAVEVVGDLATQFVAYPNSFRVGGNTNGVNTYVGVDLSDLTGGVYHAADLLDPKSTMAACWFAQLVQVATPDILNLPLTLVTPVTNIINKFIKPIAGDRDCPIVSKYDQSLFNKFPGYHYHPGPGTPAGSGNTGKNT